MIEKIFYIIETTISLTQKIFFTSKTFSSQRRMSSRSPRTWSQEQRQQGTRRDAAATLTTGNGLADLLIRSSTGEHRCVFRNGYMRGTRGSQVVLGARASRPQEVSKIFGLGTDGGRDARAPRMTTAGLESHFALTRM
jgi:hypothetical protein